MTRPAEKEPRQTVFRDSGVTPLNFKPQKPKPLYALPPMPYINTSFVSTSFVRLVVKIQIGGVGSVYVSRALRAAGTLPQLGSFLGAYGPGDLS